MSAPAKPEFRVVLTAAGRAITPDGGALSKAKIFLLEDKRLVVVHPDESGRRATRSEFELESASFSNKNARFTTTDGRTVQFLKANCNCGMGVVAHAGITDDGREILTKVRPPDWVTGL